MKTRKLGFTELELTQIGLGTWAIGGGDWSFGWGSQEERQSIETIQRALDLGINWIDTAPAYGLGDSERVVGKALRGRRDHVILATKCGLTWESADDWDVENKLAADSVRREIDDSLQRLGVDVIDLYQIHWPIPDEQIEEAWGVIADAVQAGKIRYAGVSNFDVSQIKRVQAIHPVASLQPPYSMLDRGVEDDLLAYCAANKIGVIVYSPMYSGMLTGKMTRARIDEMPRDDWRARDEQFTEPQLSANLALVERLKPLAQRYDKTLPQLAIAWTLLRPEVTAAIVGARKPSQIEETVAAGDWELPQEAVSEIHDLLGQRAVELAGAEA